MKTRRSGDVWGDAFSNVTTSSKDKKDDAWSNAFFGNASGNIMRMGKRGLATIALLHGQFFFFFANMYGRN